MLPALLRAQPDSRLWQILCLVARRQNATIAEIVATLGLTTTAVRQHVGRLIADGWLVREQRRGGPGRPADVFSLSEDARRLLAHNLDAFTRQLVRELAESEGPKKLRALLARVSQQLVQGLESAAGAGAPAERIGTLVQQMQERGTVADAQPTDSGVRLNVYTCPFHGLGDARRAICEVERQTLGRIGGGPAKLKHSIARGHWCCEFEVAMVPQRARP